MTDKGPCAETNGRVELRQAANGQIQIEDDRENWPVERDPHDGVHWSELSKMLDSPRAYKHAIDNPREPTDAMHLGDLSHRATLQPDWFRKSVIVEPDFGDLRYKEGKERRQAFWAGLVPTAKPVEKTADVAQARALLPPGIITASPAEHTRALAISDAVWSHKPAAKLLEGSETEVKMKWERMGVTCSGQTDIISADAIGDLKTTRHSSVGAILREFARRLYHGQLAWYHYGAERLGKITKFGCQFPFIIAVQSDPPHDVAVIQLTAEVFRAGEAVGNDLLSQWIGCRDSGKWPGMAPDVVQWSLDPWAPGASLIAEPDDPTDFDWF
jgi:hypothetical protein